MGKYTDLNVWHEARTLAKEIYELSKEEKVSRDFGSVDQMRRAAISVPSNIAEGDELDTNKQSIRHFHIAKGSCAEVQSLLYIGLDINYFTTDRCDGLIDQCSKIGAMLNNLIEHRKKRIAR